MDYQLARAVQSAPIAPALTRFRIAEKHEAFRRRLTGPIEAPMYFLLSPFPVTKNFS
jgi:hypothetical protein